MIKKNLFYNALLSISQFLFPLISFPYASRILGPSGIGKIYFIDSFTQYFIVISALGIPIYGIREIAKVKASQEGINKVFSEIFVIHVISALIFSIIYLLLALSVPRLGAHLDLIFIGILINFFSVFSLEWFFQGLGEFSYITIRSLIVKSLSLVFLFIFLKKGSPPNVFYSITASVFVFNGISNILYLKKKVKFKLLNLNLKVHLKPLIIIVSSTLSISIYVILDTVILGFLQNEDAVGYYTTAVRIVKIPFAIITAISTVIIPQVSHFYNEGNREEVAELVKKSFSFLMFVSIPICAGLFISSSFLIHTFAGVKFSNSIQLLQLLSPLVILVALNNLFGLQILTPIGKEKYLLKAVFIGMLISVVLNIILVKKFSYTGSAFANIITEIAVTLLCYFYAQKFFKITFDWKLIMLSIIASSSFLLIAYGIRNISMPYLYQELSIIFSCAIMYFLFMIRFSNNPYINNIKILLTNKLKTKAAV